MAGWVARDLLIWRRKALVRELEDLQSGFEMSDPASAASIEMYLAEAKHFLPLPPFGFTTLGGINYAAFGPGYRWRTV